MERGPKAPPWPAPGSVSERGVRRVGHDGGIPSWQNIEEFNHKDSTAAGSTRPTCSPCDALHLRDKPAPVRRKGSLTAACVSRWVSGPAFSATA